MQDQYDSKSEKNEEGRSDREHPERGRRSHWIDPEGREHTSDRSRGHRENRHHERNFWAEWRDERHHHGMVGSQTLKHQN